MAEAVGTAPTSPCGDSVFKTDTASLYLPDFQNIHLVTNLFLVSFLRCRKPLRKLIVSVYKNGGSYWTCTNVGITPTVLQTAPFATLANSH